MLDILTGFLKEYWPVVMIGVLGQFIDPVLSWRMRRAKQRLQREEQERRSRDGRAHSEAEGRRVKPLRAEIVGFAVDPKRKKAAHEGAAFR